MDILSGSKGVRRDTGMGKEDGRRRVSVVVRSHTARG